MKKFIVKISADPTINESYLAWANSKEEVETFIDGDIYTDLVNNLWDNYGYLYTDEDDDDEESEESAYEEFEQDCSVSIEDATNLDYIDDNTYEVIMDNREVQKYLVTIGTADIYENYVAYGHSVEEIDNYLTSIWDDITEEIFNENADEQDDLDNFIANCDSNIEAIDDEDTSELETIYDCR